jgi:hypothetical protein
LRCSTSQLINDFVDQGYAGAMDWAYSDPTGGAFSWSAAKANAKSWPDAHTCITHY